jgi:plastocyanin domain-containing protein
VSTAQVVVTLLGLAAMAWVNWYFFLAGRGEAVAATQDEGGVQRVRVDVKGGYSPSVIRVQAGTPVRLEFNRGETNPCSEELVIPDFGIRAYLPPHQVTSVSFTPDEGTHEFVCGMGMLRGSIIAEKQE